MRTSDFSFELPEHLIAQTPPDSREESRMLIVDRAAGTFTHSGIGALPELLSRHDALVLNNTKVIPARVQGRKETGGAVEILFVEPEDGTSDEWWVMMKSSHRPKPGALVQIREDVAVEVLENRNDGLNRVRVPTAPPILEILDELGAPPLPPYIAREQLHAEDRERYQTVFASAPGAVAAPTAGLHFTPSLLQRCKDQGAQICELTLHVGPGTFRPVKTDEVEDHRMDPERYEISEGSAHTLNACRDRGGKITAVGSTSVRTLETCWRSHGSFQACSGRSELFIHPPQSIGAVDQLLTNFHLPCSTLLMMMSAFAGRELMLAAYDEAIRHEYRFYSYGDCMFIR